MRVLVTGGAGFIGSHLCARLLAEGQSVTVLDDLSTGSREMLRRRCESGGSEGDSRGARVLTFKEGTTHHSKLVEELVSKADAVVHLAASVGVMSILRSRSGSILNTSRGTEVVLCAAARLGRPLLYASSSEVYGKSEELPFREDADLRLGPSTGARWSYACNKALGEWLALALADETGTPMTVLRLFNTVGPGQSAAGGMVLPRFAQQALRGAPLSVYGDGQQSRCFAHVDEVVEVMFRLLSRPARGAEVFNVGSPRELSIQQLAERVIAAAESSSLVEFIPYDAAYGPGFEDFPRRVPDLSRLRAAIDFVPEGSLGRILTDVLQHERERLLGGDSPTSVGPRDAEEEGRRPSGGGRKGEPA